MSTNRRQSSDHPPEGFISKRASLESGSAYQQEVVRDLHWLIYSPSLMTPPDNESSDWLFTAPDIDAQLAILDQNPQPLISQLRQQAQFRLGYYFEDLVRLYINIFTQPTDLKHNIQVSRDKTTVGEYDFLMALKNGIKVHIEAAVKFYLCTSDDIHHCDLKDFIGPNRSDRLDRKWQRLTGHQLQLSKTEAGKNQANALGLLPDRHSLLMRGYLFYPYHQWQQYSPPAPINPEHLKGWWIRAAEAGSLGSDYQYVILMKPRWMALARCCFQETLSNTELTKMTDSISTPMLIARLRFKDGLWRETDRGFIVPDNWNLLP